MMGWRGDGLKDAGCLAGSEGRGKGQSKPADFIPYLCSFPNLCSPSLPSCLQICASIGLCPAVAAAKEQAFASARRSLARYTGEHKPRRGLCGLLLFLSRLAGFEQKLDVPGPWGYLLLMVPYKVCKASFWTASLTCFALYCNAPAAAGKTGRIAADSAQAAAQQGTTPAWARMVNAGAEAAGVKVGGAGCPEQGSSSGSVPCKQQIELLQCGTLPDQDRS